MTDLEKPVVELKAIVILSGPWGPYTKVVRGKYTEHLFITNNNERYKHENMFPYAEPFITLARKINGNDKRHHEVRHQHTVEQYGLIRKMRETKDTEGGQ